MPVVARIDQYASLQALEFDEITSSTKIGPDASGTFFANEFSENLEATPLVTNVFASYDLVTGDFASAPFGAGLGTYVRQTPASVCVVYNEIDEVTNLV
jgi:hypothetical protein